MEGLNIEPVVRYEDYDQDSKADNKGEKNTTAGVTKEFISKASFCTIEWLI